MFTKRQALHASRMANQDSRLYIESLINNYNLNDNDDPISRVFWRTHIEKFANPKNDTEKSLVEAMIHSLV